MKSLSPNAQEFIPSLNGPVHPMVSGNLSHPSMYQSQSVQLLQMPSSSLMMFDHHHHHNLHHSGSPIQHSAAAYSQPPPPPNHLVAVSQVQMPPPPPPPATYGIYSPTDHHMPSQYHHQQQQQYQSNTSAQQQQQQQVNYMMQANSNSTSSKSKPITVNTTTATVNNTQQYATPGYPMAPPSYQINSPVLISTYAAPPPLSAQQQAMLAANSPHHHHHHHHHQISPVASLASPSQTIILQQQQQQQASPQMPPPSQVSYHHPPNPNYYQPQQTLVSQSVPSGGGGSNAMFYHNNSIVQQQQQPNQLMMASHAVPLNQSYPPHNHYAAVSNTQQSNNVKASLSFNSTNKSASKSTKGRQVKGKPMSNAGKQLNEINIDDSQAFPSLVNVAKSTKSAPRPAAEAHMASDDEENSDNSDSNEVTPRVPAKPYIEDGVKFEKVKKNFSFIRSTIEQHYMNENSRNRNNQQHQQQLSFREAVLKKPVLPKTVPEEKSADAKEAAAKTKKPEVAAAKLDEAEKKEEKKSKKKKKAKKSAGPAEEQQNQQQQQQFDLAKEDFPNLAPTGGSSLPKFDLEPKTVEWKRTSQEKEVPKPSATVSAAPAPTALADPGKKSRQPMVFEFANMISALEKGQHHEKRKNPSSTGSGYPLGRVPGGSKSKNGLALPINPLDPNAPTVKRGKEREKPKAKKQSTLKKIILKEREEKKRLRMQSQQLVVADTMVDPDPMAVLGLAAGDLMALPSSAGLNLTEPVVQEGTQKSESLSLSDSAEKHVEDSEESDENDENESDEDEDDDDDDESDEDEDEEESEESEEESDEEVEEESEKIKEKVEAAPATDTGLNASSGGEEATANNNNAEKPVLEYDTSNDNDDNGNVASNKMSPISQGSPISYGGYTPTPYGMAMLPADRALLSLDKLEEQVKQKIHSRKFREYCNQIINKDIDSVCMALLHEIVRFQDRLYHKNPAKAKNKRRYVMGIREVTKHLKLCKLKCVILAPNCEKIQSKGGLDDAINCIIQTAMEQNIPFVFALGRKGLGKAVNKLVPISVVGIFDYSGAEEYFKRLVELANNAKQAYQEIVEEYEKEECENLIIMQSDKVSHGGLFAPMIPTMAANAGGNGIAYINNSVYTNYHLLNQQIVSTQNPIIPSHMGHSRTPSNSSNISIEPYFINYHHHSSHSRSASGNFNFGAPAVPRPGHSRSASGGGGGTLNIDLSLHGPVAGAKPHWTHSRTPSNCSNISFISRFSEPISEIGSVGTLLMGGGNANSSNSNLAAYLIGGGPNAVHPSMASGENSKFSAVQHYVESVRQEFRESDPSNADAAYESDKPAEEPDQQPIELESNKAKPEPPSPSSQPVSSSLSNLHLGCINELDGANEAEDVDSQAEKNSTDQNNLSSSSSSVHINPSSNDDDARKQPKPTESV